MLYQSTYDTPIGQLLLVSDLDSLKGIWFLGQKYFRSSLKEEARDGDDLSILAQTRAWLDRYLAGDRPEPGELQLVPDGTAFRQEVWKILLEIPYGQTMSYGEIAGLMAQKRGHDQMSARAVGGAVGHNPISIVIPCHRVIGADGSLTGFGGGLPRKTWLLQHEGVFSGRPHELNSI